MARRSRPSQRSAVLGPVKDEPSGLKKAILDGVCARWPGKSAVGAEECLRRGRTKECGL